MAYTPQQVKDINTARAANVAVGKDANSGAGATTAQPIPAPTTQANPLAPAPTGSNTPINTSQPNPTTANATPYTSTEPTVTGIPSNFIDSYQKAATNLAKMPLPTDPGIAKAAVGGAVKAATPVTQDTTQAQAVLDANQAHQQILSDYTQSQQSDNQSANFTNYYNNLSNQLNIPTLNTDLINMKNVINGTEQDIQNEIAKAGGFATNSQVAALTTARNKSLISNYNSLLQTRDNAVKELDTMQGLYEKDQAYAKSQIDSKLNFDKEQAAFADKAVTNAKDALASMEKTEGWSGIYKAAIASGDPNAISRINSTMGAGFDLASVAEADAKTRAQTAIKDSAQVVTEKAAIDKANEDAGIPVPSKANQPGFNDKGVKYDTQSAQNEIISLWKSQGVLDKNNVIPPANYNQAKAWWVSNKLPAAEFDSIMGQYKGDQTNKQYN